MSFLALRSPCLQHGMSRITNSCHEMNDIILVKINSLSPTVQARMTFVSLLHYCGYCELSATSSIKSSDNIHCDVQLKSKLQGFGLSNIRMSQRVQSQISRVSPSWRLSSTKGVGTSLIV